MPVAGYDSQGMQAALGESDRRCTICGLEGRTVRADFIAGDAQGFQWFECQGHGPNDHPMAGARTKRMGLQAWLKQVHDHVMAPTRALAAKADRAKAALDNLRQLAGPPGKPKASEMDEGDLRQWPCPSCLTFDRWRALLHRAMGMKLKRSAEILGVTPEKLRLMYVDIMRSCGFEPGSIQRDDIDDHWSKSTCPSIKTAHYVMTQVCDREGLPIPYFEGKEENLP